MVEAGGFILEKRRRGEERKMRGEEEGRGRGEERRRGKEEKRRRIVFSFDLA